MERTAALAATAAARWSDAEDEDEESASDTEEFSQFRASIATGELFLGEASDHLSILIRKGAHQRIYVAPTALTESQFTYHVDVDPPSDLFIATATHSTAAELLIQRIVRVVSVPAPSGRVFKLHHAMGKPAVQKEFYDSQGDRTQAPRPGEPCWIVYRLYFEVKENENVANVLALDWE